MSAPLPRDVLIGRLADLIRGGRYARVAVDGPDAAGKTTLADELAARLAGTRNVIRGSVDDHHLPRETRYRRGSLSPEGCYRDSFDNGAVRRLAAGVGDEAVLVFDGVFLLRPELRDCWDLSILLDIGPDETVRRALIRDGALMGGPDEVRLRYRERYLPAQRLYREEAQPHRIADIVIDNSDPALPRVLRWPGPANGLAPAS